jgi:hypothetical protein
LTTTATVSGGGSAATSTLEPLWVSEGVLLAGWIREGKTGGGAPAGCCDEVCCLKVTSF